MIIKMIRARGLALVKALRSGRYQQGKGNLCTQEAGTGADVRHCCLGVATVLAEEAGVIGPMECYTYYHPDPGDDGEIDVPRDIMAWIDPLDGDPHSTMLPTSVARWYGLMTPDEELYPEVVDPRVHVTLEFIEQYPGLVHVGDENPTASLSALNDAGVPFNVIADLIEEQLIQEEEDTNDQ